VEGEYFKIKISTLIFRLTVFHYIIGVVLFSSTSDRVLNIEKESLGKYEEE
jgi:hypothetical protein